MKSWNFLVSGSDICARLAVLVDLLRCTRHKTGVRGLIQASKSGVLTAVWVLNKHCSAFCSIKVATKPGMSRTNSRSKGQNQWSFQDGIEQRNVSLHHVATQSLAVCSGHSRRDILECI